MLLDAADDEREYWQMVYYRAFQPAARGPHVAREANLCGPRGQLLQYKFLINEMIKLEYTGSKISIL